MMHGQQKSDPCDVAKKPMNKPGRPGAELVERRRGAVGNMVKLRTDRTQGRAAVSQRLDRVRQAARQRKKERFTALFHYVDIELLRESFFWLQRKAAPGVDGVRWDDYERNLEVSLADLHERLHRGTYRALPSRRQYIAKPDGSQRPLGIAALEDKIVQRAVVEVLNAVYEADFLGFSYGFRPGRSQHDALDALAVGITHTRVNFILDADVSQFFDCVSHEWLVRFVEHRIGDPRILRLVRKWLKAGVMEDGEVTAAGAAAVRSCFSGRRGGTGCEWRCAALGMSCVAFGMRPHSGARGLAAPRGGGVLRISRSTHELPAPESVPLSRDRALAAFASAPQSKGLVQVGAHLSTGRPLASTPAHRSSVARSALCRQVPTVGARCANRARRDLCGGCSVMGISYRNHLG